MMMTMMTKNAKTRKLRYLSNNVIMQNAALECTGGR